MRILLLAANDFLRLLLMRPKVCFLGIWQGVLKCMMVSSRESQNLSWKGLSLGPCLKRTISEGRNWEKRYNNIWRSFLHYGIWIKVEERGCPSRDFFSNKRKCLKILFREANTYLKGLSKIMHCSDRANNFRCARYKIVTLYTFTHIAVLCIL